MSLYSNGSDIITVIQEDFTGRKLQKFRSNAINEEEIAKIFQSVIDKYGLNLKVVKSQANKSISWLDADETFSW